MNDLGEKARAFLAHQVWMNQSDNPKNPFLVKKKHIEAAKKGELPNPAEQLDNFIFYVGNKQTNATAQMMDITSKYLRAKVGCIEADAVHYIRGAAVEEGLFKADKEGSIGKGHLTLNGWRYFEKLKRGRSDSRMAFMAMPFDVPEITKMFKEIFVPAVDKTGFKLERVIDKPQAGIIDNHILVRIRLSRFVVVDLTGDNLGAYWEAGFAEGLGKPVIYTCKKSSFKKKKPHFDANHRHTVLWDPDNPEDAVRDLKATIRNTLPFESKMEDDPKPV